MNGFLKQSTNQCKHVWILRQHTPRVAGGGRGGTVVKQTHTHTATSEFVLLKIKRRPLKMFFQENSFAFKGSFFLKEASSSVVPKKQSFSFGSIVVMLSWMWTNRPSEQKCASFYPLSLSLESRPHSSHSLLKGISWPSGIHFLFLNRFMVFRYETVPGRVAELWT